MLIDGYPCKGAQEHHQDQAEHTDHGQNGSADVNLYLGDMSTQEQFHSAVLDLAVEKSRGYAHCEQEIKDQNDRMLITDGNKGRDIPFLQCRSSQGGFDKRRHVVQELYHEFDVVVFLNNPADSDLDQKDQQADTEPYNIKHENMASAFLDFIPTSPF